METSREEDCEKAAPALSAEKVSKRSMRIYLSIMTAFKLNCRPDAMKMLTVTVRSILEFEGRLKLSNRFQVTWLTHDAPDAALSLTCFDVHKQDQKSVAKRRSSHGGGLLVIKMESSSRDSMLIFTQRILWL